MSFVNPVAWFSGFSHEWAVFLMSMIPITELRAAIPIGIEVYDLPVWKVWIFALGFIGMALGISQITRSANKATAIGVTFWIITSVLYHLGNHFEGEGFKRIWTFVLMVIPQGHRMDLWRAGTSHLASALLFLLSLGMVYTFIGYILTAKKDV